MSRILDFHTPNIAGKAANAKGNTFQNNQSNNALDYERFEVSIEFNSMRIE